MNLDIERRHAIRVAALPLILDRGYLSVSLADAAEACGLTLDELTAEFSSTREIVTQNDYFTVIVNAFRSSSNELSCAAAWVVAIDEIAATMSAEEWTTERLRNEIFARDEEAIGGLVSEIVRIITELNDAVAERSGLPVSTPVTIFSGTVLGTMLSMPLGFFPEPCNWVDAHAVAIEALGPGLDSMLRASAQTSPAQASSAQT